MNEEIRAENTVENELETEKLLFEEPELEFIIFSGSDIVTASGDIDFPVIDDDGDGEIDTPIIDDDDEYDDGEGGEEGGGEEEGGGGSDVETPELQGCLDSRSASLNYEYFNNKPLETVD